MGSLGSFQESQALSNLDKICRECAWPTVLNYFVKYWADGIYDILNFSLGYGLILQNQVGLGFENAAVNICGSVFTKPDY